jgi:DnaJ-class molecular chaperone
MAKQKCDKCRGSGQEKYHINPMGIDDPDYQPVYGFKPCSKCKGKGRLKNDS